MADVDVLVVREDDFGALKEPTKSTADQRDRPSAAVIHRLLFSAEQRVRAVTEQEIDYLRDWSDAVLVAELAENRDNIRGVVIIGVEVFARIRTKHGNLNRRHRVDFFTVVFTPALGQKGVGIGRVVGMSRGEEVAENSPGELHQRQTTSLLVEVEHMGNNQAMNDLDSIRFFESLLQEMPDAVNVVFQKALVDRFRQGVYTRAQALEDGVLVDVTETAHEAGFRFPVALTATLWSVVETIPKRHSYQDWKGRLWDVLYMASLAVRKAKSESRIVYELILFREGNRRKCVTLVCDSGPGDGGEPVITIGFPEDF
jgi:hypothetical protein